MIATTKLKEPSEVDRRLDEMQLDRRKLLEVRDVARAAAANSTVLHAANAAGTFAYQEGTWALRDRHVELGWVVDRTGGVEGMRHDQLNLRIVFSNVDVASEEAKSPKPRSPKGAGAERVCQGNLFHDAELPEFAPASFDSIATYYLMVDDRGAVELSRPVVRGSTFSSYIERIFISYGDEVDLIDGLLDVTDRVDEFSPMVIRK